MFKHGLLFVVAMVVGVCACSGSGGTGSSSGSTSSGTGGLGGSGGSGGAGGSDPCWPTDVDYSGCTGSTFFPDGTCAKGACATGDVVTKVFAEWFAQARTASGLTESAFWERVAVSKVEPSGKFIRIEVVLVIDWARSREAFSIDTSGFSPVPTPTEIQKAVAFANLGFQWQTFGAITQVAPTSDIRAAFAACQCNVKVDWCHVRMRNGSPAFFGVDGIAVIDMAANQCKDAIVDVVTGTGNACTDTPCGIN